MNESIIQTALETGDAASGELALNEIDAQLRRSNGRKEKADLLLRKAVLCGVLHRFEDARLQLKLARDCAPDDPDVRFQFDFINATLYDQEGDIEQAFKTLTSVFVGNRDLLREARLRFAYEDIQLRRGLDAAKLGKNEDAIPLLQEASSFPLSPENRVAVLSNIGVIYSNLGDYENAKQYLLQAQEIGLDNEWEGTVRLHLAIAYANLHFFREAKEEFLLCEQKANDYGLALNKIYGWLSWVCKGLGEEKESKEYARLARIA